jgi:hypothetical protein
VQRTDTHDSSGCMRLTHRTGQDAMRTEDARLRAQYERICGCARGERGEADVPVCGGVLVMGV